MVKHSQTICRQELASTKQKWFLKWQSLILFFNTRSFIFLFFILFTELAQSNKLGFFSLISKRCHLGNHISLSMLLRSSPPRVFLEKGIREICSKSTGKHPCRSKISIKLLRNFIKIAPWHISAVNVLHILRIPVLKNIYVGLNLAFPVSIINTFQINASFLYLSIPEVLWFFSVSIGMEHWPDMGQHIYIFRSLYIFRGGSRTAVTSKMEFFLIIVNGWKPLTISTKCSILDVTAALDLPLILLKAFYQYQISKFSKTVYSFLYNLFIQFFQLKKLVSNQIINPF